MQSIWRETVSAPHFETLTGDIHTEVAVVGGGITGILLAEQLRRNGKKAVVLEAGRIGGGQTAGTTAKITAQHGLFYHNLLKRYGLDVARLYAQSNLKAIENYRTLVREQHIDCDWQECSSYLYSRKNREVLEAEALAEVTLGLPVLFSAVTPLPFTVAGAVRMDGQAMFHPLRFLYALASRLTVYEKTPVLSVDTHRLLTPNGVVTADYIVFATHFPLVDVPGKYFMRLHQERSLVLAIRGATPLKDMYYGVDKHDLSIRPFRDMLLVGGEGYRTGATHMGSYATLERRARMWFPEGSVVANWSAQDCMPARDIPYIGRYDQKHLNWFVATGYKKWGMTTSMIAATLLADMICSRENPLEMLYSPAVYDVRELPQMLSDGCHTVAAFASYAIPSLQKPHRLQAGKGGKTGFIRGAYKDADLHLTTVSLRCPHLGCKLRWNKVEKTWECPCHGSRFNRHGKRISGPAQKDITQ